jgi:hypothetical protein
MAYATGPTCAEHDPDTLPDPGFTVQDPVAVVSGAGFMIGAFVRQQGCAVAQSRMGSTSSLGKLCSLWQALLASRTLFKSTACNILCTCDAVIQFQATQDRCKPQIGSCGMRVCRPRVRAWICLAS